MMFRKSSPARKNPWLLLIPLLLLVWAGIAMAQDGGVQATYQVETEAVGTGAVLLIFLALVVLALLGEPLFVILGIVGVLCFMLLERGYDTFGAYQKFVVNIANLSTKNVLLAIPFFVVSGTIMSAGTIATRLIAFARAMVGWMPGGLAVATIFACVFFAAISGSSPVTVIAIGSVMLPALMKEKYREEFALGTLTAAGSLGIVIPPSIPMLVYALVASNTAPVDVGEMFLAGVVPGMMLAGLMAVYAVLVGAREKLPTHRFDAKEVWNTFREGFWALGLPVVILGGIYSGLFTPTEAAAVSVAYALVVELFIHRQLAWTDLRSSLIESGIAMGALLLIMAFSFGLNDFLVERRIPEMAADWIAQQEMSPVMFLLAVNVLLILVGCLMDSISALLIIAPLLVPIAHAMRFDLVHVGLVFIINLEIGYLTPPIGMNLFVASSVFKKPLGMVVRGALPFLAILAVGLVAVTYVPTISLGLVNGMLRDQPVWASFPSAVPEPEPTAAAVATPLPEGNVMTIQEMMEAARREREGANGEDGEVAESPSPTPAKVLTIQEMMKKAREEPSAPTPEASPAPAP